VRQIIGKAMPRMAKPRGERKVTMEGVPFEVHTAWAALGWRSEKIMNNASEERWKMTLVGESLAGFLDLGNAGVEGGEGRAVHKKETGELAACGRLEVVFARRGDGYLSVRDKMHVCFDLFIVSRNMFVREDVYEFNRLNLWDKYGAALGLSAQEAQEHEYAELKALAAPYSFTTVFGVPTSISRIFTFPWYPEVTRGGDAAGVPGGPDDIDDAGAAAIVPTPLSPHAASLRSTALYILAILCILYISAC